MKASELDFSKIDKLSYNEYPVGVLDRMSSKIIELQAKIRSLSPDFVMIPSPVFGAHVRDSSKSAHSTSWDGAPNSRLSTATDFYTSWSAVPKIWEWAQSVPELGGFGLYLDTFYDGVSRPLFHIDTMESRGQRLVWLRYCRYNTFHVPGKKKDSKYVYQSTDWGKFHTVLAEAAIKWR